MVASQRSILEVRCPLLCLDGSSIIVPLPDVEVTHRLGGEGDIFCCHSRLFTKSVAVARRDPATFDPMDLFDLVSSSLGDTSSEAVTPSGPYSRPFLSMTLAQSSPLIKMGGGRTWLGGPEWPQKM